MTRTEQLAAEQKAERRQASLGKKCPGRVGGVKAARAKQRGERLNHLFELAKPLLANSTSVKELSKHLDRSLQVVRDYLADWETMDLVTNPYGGQVWALPGVAVIPATAPKTIRLWVAVGDKRYGGPIVSERKPAVGKNGVVIVRHELGDNACTVCECLKRLELPEGYVGQIELKVIG